MRINVKREMRIDDFADEVGVAVSCDPFVGVIPEEVVAPVKVAVGVASVSVVAIAVVVGCVCVCSASVEVVSIAELMIKSGSLQRSVVQQAALGNIALACFKAWQFSVAMMM
jgi:hypothetical protein